MLAAGIAIFVGAVWIFQQSIGQSGGAGVITTAMRGMMSLPDDFILGVDLGILLLAMAAMTWIYRRNLAAWHDRQHEVCRQCGYDLRATPRKRGGGQCPECGEEFAVF